MDYVKVCVLQKYADFSGRARRAEYWSFALSAGVISAILNALGRNGNGGFFSILAYLFSLAILIPSLAVAWRRLHDIGKKGTWYFIGLIPVVGWILLIVWFCRDSEPGDNEFGPNPKGDR
ncbi:MAG: DUF805 domain-containing protein [Oscillospiraceae bacterium]|nr:DUF805 domain-containing protein [Oscillospiraceae bacterium]